jgi:hypothetical protein
MASLWDKPAAQQTKGSPSTTTRKSGEREDFTSLLVGQLANKAMNASRSSAPFDTPPRHQPGTLPFVLCMLTFPEVSSLSGFQSPYTPPTPVQRAPPAPIFTTPQREQNSAMAATAQNKQPTPSANDTSARAPETPKVGGKWIHPALQGIDKEARKFIFGEEDLKRLVINLFLLYTLWWVSSKVEEM